MKRQVPTLPAFWSLENIALFDTMDEVPGYDR